MKTISPIKKRISSVVTHFSPRFSIKSFILLWFISLLILVLFSYQAIIFKGLPFNLFHGWNGVQQFQAIKSLNFIADLKKRQLHEQLSEFTADTKYLSASPSIAKNIGLIQTQNKLANKVAQNEQFFNDALALIQVFLNTHSDIYKKISIVDASTGAILISSNTTDVGANMLGDTVFIKTLELGSIYIGGIKINKDEDEAYFQIAHTIKNQTGDIIAVLIADIPVQRMLKPLLHLGDGLGKTGEALLVNEEGVLLTDLKHPLTSGLQAEVMKFKIKTKTASLAAKGFEGVIKTYDYRDERVLAAYRHIRISPDWAWGLVVKIDDAELFESIHQAKYYSLAILIAAILISFALSFYLARWLTLPLQKLTSNAEKLAEGDYSIRSSYKSDNEVGVLAKAFNLMATKIENVYQEQEDIIKLRTKDLEASKMFFKTIFEEAPLGIALIDSLTGKIYELNIKFANIVGRTQDEMKTMDWMKITHPDDIQLDIDNMALLNAKKISGFQMEKRYIHSNGSIVWINMTIAPMSVENTEQPRHLCMIEDITQRKQSEQALKQSEARYERAVNGTNDGIWEWNVVTGEDYLSPQWKKLLGYQEDELPNVQGSFFDNIHPDDYPSVLEAKDLHFQEHKPYNVELRLRCKNGDYRWFHSRGQAIWDEQGQPLIQSGSITDITERKQAEEALQQSEFRWKFAIEGAGDGVWDWDIQTNQVVYSKRWIEMLGYAADDILPANDEWVTRIHPDDQAYVAQTMQAYLEDKTEIYVVEYRLKCKDGNYKWILGRGMVVSRSEDGKPLRMIGTHTDISERKQAEQQLRKLALAVEQSPESIAITNLNNQIEYVNQTFLKTSGYSREDVLGENPRVLHSGKTPRQTYVQMWEALTNGMTWKGEFYNKRKDGSEYIEFAIITPLRQTDGSISHYVAIKEDITEKKQMSAELDNHRHHLEKLVETRTAELEKAKLAAEAANIAKSQFIATMSHEIRTPMNGVIGMVEVLRQSTLDASQIEMVETIHDSGLSLLGIIEDILDFSKIEAGKLELEQRAINLAAEVEKVCVMLDQMALNKGVELLLFIDPKLPEQVLGDNLRLRQIMINLTNNAIKFCSNQSQAGRVCVRVFLLEYTANKKAARIEIQIADNGIGMDENTQAKLFSPFTQADSSTTRHFGGTGLGLSIVRRLVELMHGKVSVESQPGNGSTFKVKLVLDVVKSDTNNDFNAALKNITCLLIGEQKELLGYVESYLMAADLAVEKAKNVAMATEKIIHPPQCQAWIWIIDTREINFQPQDLEQIAASCDLIRFVLIEHGKRRALRWLKQDLILSVDCNALTRKSLLNAVAVSAGRIAINNNIAYKQANSESSLSTLSIVANKWILIAEDNETNQKVILRQLELLGFKADVAADGAEALALWRNGKYALLLTDIQMPKMDGYQLSHAIRAEETTHSIIIALSANASKHDVLQAQQAQMDDYLPKPVAMKSLQACLEKWLVPATAESASVSTKTEITDAKKIEAADKILKSVDVSVLAALVGDSAEIIKDFLQDFQRTANKTATELDAAYKAGQILQVGSLAHRLKSAACSVGAMSLGKICAEMEQAGKAKALEKLEKLLPLFEAELEAVNNALEKLITE